MIRKLLFSEDYGRNVIWLMLSGFFLKIEAKENFFGQIILPKDHYLFNLDYTVLNNEYLKYNNLHFIILDGPVQHLTDTRVNQIKKKINIHYVGKFSNYWKNIENSQLLFPESYEVQENILEQVKKKFPIFFKKYLLKKIATTFLGIKNTNLFTNHVIKKEKYVYYGYIKPTQNHIDVYKNFLNLKDNQLNYFFESNINVNILQKKIKEICNLKEYLMNTVKKYHYPYVNEFLLFMIRNVLCNFLKSKKNFLIYDGIGGNFNFNAYEMFFGSHHTYLDLGSKVGYDEIYPRSALLNLCKRKTTRFICEESFFYLNKDDSNLFIQERADSFLKKLNI